MPRGKKIHVYANLHCAFEVTRDSKLARPPFTYPRSVMSLRRALSKNTTRTLEPCLPAIIFFPPLSVNTKCNQKHVNNHLIPVEMYRNWV